MKITLKNLKNKGGFFGLNIVVLIFWFALIAPAYSHKSVAPQVFDYYSYMYVGYLLFITLPAVVYAFISLLTGERINRNLFFLLIAVLVAGEMIVRYRTTSLDPLRYGGMRESRPYTVFGGARNAKVDVEIPLSLDANGRVTFKKVKIVLNKLGFRGELPGKKKKGEFRIIVLGGSTVFLGTSVRKSIPGQIEKLIHEKGLSHVKVYNWGVASVVSGQELSTLIHTAVDYQPDLVIAYDGLNDIFSKYADYDPRPGYPTNFIPYEVGLRLIAGRWTLEEMTLAVFRKSHIVRKIFFVHLGGMHTHKIKLRKEAGYRTQRWEEEIARKYVGNQTKMCRIGSGFGFKFASFLQPMIQQKKNLTKNERPFRYGKKYSEYILRIYEKSRAGFRLAQKSLEKTKCIFADISDVYKNDKRDVYYDMGHTFDYAKPAVAKVIVSHVMKMIPRSN
ncbi:MAG: SGNH/GDSL hydrolase family protein [Nitrospinaceae bacterium]|jgi:hypothetical protein|nr:SGNH/GDSL hydrolase family protein [Nitrospinaceae bacterium]